MGIQDRDYMREKRLRWDERRGEMRLDEPQVKRPAVRWPALAIAVACAAVVAAAGWMWWRSQPQIMAGSASVEVVEPPQGEAAFEQQWVPEGPVLEGRVTAVTDGDSIKVELDSGPIEVRMHSIDAPERDQPGGAEAREALTQRLGNAAVALEPVEQDQYGRIIAVVYQGEANVNAWMVREGHAWVYRQYARDARYCEAEIAARADGRGVWALPGSEQLAPWEWRAIKRGRRDGYSDYSGETLERCVAALGKRSQPVSDSVSSGSSQSPEGPSRGMGESHSDERPDRKSGPVHSEAGTAQRRDRERASRDGSTACPAGDCELPDGAAAPPSTADTTRDGCRIKGNIGGSGKVYHVPGTAAYAKTKIDESKGERWFCSEDEAWAAGWRKPRG